MFFAGGGSQRAAPPAANSVKKAAAATAQAFTAAEFARRGAGATRRPYSGLKSFSIAVFLIYDSAESKST